MWQTLGRIVGVTLFWAAISFFATAAGVAASQAELFSGIGAGLSLIAWGIALHRAAPSVAESGSPAQPTVLPGRERATV